MSLSKDNLSSELDAFFTTLLAEARTTVDTETEGAPPPIDFRDRLRLFSEGVRWAAVKARVETEDTQDEFSRLRAGTVGGTRKRSASGPSARTNGRAANGAGTA